MHVITAIPMMKFAGKKKQSKDTFKLSYNINPPLPPPIENGNIIICYLGVS